MFKILLVGSVDNSAPIYDDGVRESFGGGVTYGSKSAIKLGLSSSIVTVGGEDLEPALAELRSVGVRVSRVTRKVSNNFASDWRGGKRRLRMSSYVDKPLMPKEFPPNLDQYDAVMLFPLYHEITPQVAELFKEGQVVYLDPQGLTRKINGKDEEGFLLVDQTHWKDIDGYLDKIDVLKMSDEDLQQIEFPADVTHETHKVKYLAEYGFPLVILTRSTKSTLVVRRSQRMVEVPVFPVTVVDAEGAGDTFGAAFMTEYLRTKNPVKAAAFGNACASFKVAGEDYDYKKVRARAKEILSAV